MTLVQTLAKLQEILNNASKHTVGGKSSRSTTQAQRTHYTFTEGQRQRLQELLTGLDGHFHELRADVVRYQNTIRQLNDQLALIRAAEETSKDGIDMYFGDSLEPQDRVS